jgi:hypothetical protein
MLEVRLIEPHGIALSAIVCRAVFPQAYAAASRKAKERGGRVEVRDTGRALRHRSRAP